MNSGVVDTFYVFALFNEHDEADEWALRCGADASHAFVFTSWVLMEFADGMAMSDARRLVLPFIERLRSDHRTIFIEADQVMFDRGLALYSRRPDKAWSLTDCISFNIMSDKHIAQALTGDHHFEQAGFVALDS